MAGGVSGAAIYLPPLMPVSPGDNMGSGINSSMFSNMAGCMSGAPIFIFSGIPIVCCNHTCQSCGTCASIIYASRCFRAYLQLL